MSTAARMMMMMGALAVVAVRGEEEDSEEGKFDWLLGLGIALVLLMWFCIVMAGLLKLAWDWWHNRRHAPHSDGSHKQLVGSSETPSIQSTVSTPTTPTAGVPLEHEKGMPVMELAQLERVPPVVLTV